jgi:Ni,Fe-hydrogenase maturation factor
VTDTRQTTFTFADHPFTLSPCHLVTLIGYGNDLRGDDAVGQRVAMAVAHWRRPDLLAIFVDASGAERELMDICARPIVPVSSHVMAGHTADPRTLLALAQLVYGRYPQAWWITIPALRYDFGADLSPEARRGAAAALGRIRALVRTTRSQLCTKSG